MQDANALPKDLQTVTRPVYALSVLIKGQGGFIFILKTLYRTSM